MGRYVWEVYARHGGRPAGFVGRYPDREAAERGQRDTRQTTIIRRVRIDDSDHSDWTLKGQKPRGWTGQDHPGQGGRRWTVRGPGQTTWAGPGLTWEAAVRLRAEALDAGISDAQIFPDSEAW
jgi:hypothetical protein